MIQRPEPAVRIQRALRTHPIAALIGPRQSGKTTLARQIAEAEPSEFFDLAERLTKPPSPSRSRASRGG